MRKFCFLCGKKTDKLINSYCEECYNKGHQLAKIPERLEIIVCPKCGLAKIGMWKKLDIEDFLKSKIKVNGRIKDIKINKIAKGYEVEANGYLPKSKKIKTEKYFVNIHLDKRICKVCAKRLSGYYEAILQIRLKSMLNIQKIINLIDKEIIKISKKDQMAFYRIEQKGKNLDFYIGSKICARKIAYLLKKKYNAYIKTTYKLVTKKEGKDVYRNIYSIRI